MSGENQTVPTTRLAGRRAVITGAGNGIGRAIATGFCEAGAAVGLLDVNEEGVKTLAEALQDGGGVATAAVCDVSQAKEVRASMGAVASALGGLDLVVSGAAVFTPSVTLHELPDEEWDRALAVNLSGAFNVCKHAMPYLLDAGHGGIILIASQMGRVANPGQAAYCATKGALIQFAKGMALDYAGLGIRVNALSPGGVVTNRLIERYGDTETAEREWGPRHPLGRLAQPEEIARAALFLASEESSFMTGSDLLIDGGYTAL